MISLVSIITFYDYCKMCHCIEKAVFGERLLFTDMPKALKQWGKLFSKSLFHRASAFLMV